MNLFTYIWQYIKLATVMDVLDILIVAYLVYRGFQLIRGTSAERLLKGIVLLLVITQVSEWLELMVINFVMRYIMQAGLIAIVIVFQPEIRKMLDQVGRSRFASFADRLSGENDSEELAIIQVVEACSAMSWTKTGALIVFERGDKLGDIMKTGTMIDAKISAELTKNIFFPNSPLHDGAAVIRRNRLVSAGCVLPLSANHNLSRDLGTRHRAAVGMSEVSDAVCVVVSEETGSMSVAIGGVLKRHLAPETLETLLIKELTSQNEEKPRSIFNWRGKAK